MITIIFGAPGSGKSSLSTYFLINTYRTEGRMRQKYASRCTEVANSARRNPLIIPSSPPIFANYRVRFKVGYERWYEPYYINGYYIGLPNDKMPTQYIPPYSAVFLSEAQRYYNSRKSSGFPDWVSRYFEMHRHYHIDFWLDVQRPILIDANIRELCKRFLEVREMQHTTDRSGQIVQTRFVCRVFEQWGAVESYLAGNLNCGGVIVYTYDGNIFRAFDSYSYYKSFLPPEDKNYVLLPFDGADGADNVYYRTDEPREYRGGK